MGLVARRPSGVTGLVERRWSLVCIISSKGVCLLLQYLLQSCSRGGGGGMEDMCYEGVF